MATKNNPGKYDCYTNAEPDEPMFVLLARDVTSQYFVAAWTAVRCGDLETAHLMMTYALRELEKAGKAPKLPTDDKMVDANECSKAMRTWLLNKTLDRVDANECSKAMRTWLLNKTLDRVEEKCRSISEGK